MIWLLPCSSVRASVCFWLLSHQTNPAITARIVTMVTVSILVVRLSEFQRWFIGLLQVRTVRDDGLDGCRGRGGTILGWRLALPMRDRPVTLAVVDALLCDERGVIACSVMPRLSWPL